MIFIIFVYIWNQRPPLTPDPSSPNPRHCSKCHPHPHSYHIPGQNLQQFLSASKCTNQITHLDSIYVASLHKCMFYYYYFYYLYCWAYIVLYRVAAAMPRGGRGWAMLEQSNDVLCRWQLTDTLCTRILFCVSFSPPPVPFTRRRPNRFHIISNYNWNRNSCQWGRLITWNCSVGPTLVINHSDRWTPTLLWGQSIKYHLRNERISQINSIIYYITRHKYKIELKNKCNLCFSWCVCDERKPYAYYPHCLPVIQSSIHRSLSPFVRPSTSPPPFPRM